MKPAYLSYLTQSSTILKAASGQPIALWELAIPKDEACLKEWAFRFRQHYCADAELEQLYCESGMTKSNYLTSFVFPDASTAPGPSIRSGDFAELLISDFVEFMLGYWVPREKYGEKGSRNESAKGVDILGFKVIVEGAHSPDDELISFEVKAQLTGAPYSGRLQNAIDDSSKDYTRAGATLHAARRRSLRANDPEKAALIGRFQNLTDRPYKLLFGAAAVLSDASFDVQGVASSSTDNHMRSASLRLMVVKGTELMKLVHTLYERAANEA